MREARKSCRLFRPDKLRSSRDGIHHDEGPEHTGPGPAFMGPHTSSCVSAHKGETRRDVALVFSPLFCMRVFAPLSLRFELVESQRFE